MLGPMLYHNQRNMLVKVKIGLSWHCKAKGHVMPSLTPIPQPTQHGLQVKIGII
jgi:hypothetical protein